MSDVHRNYVFDFGYLLRENVLEAKQSARALKAQVMKLINWDGRWLITR
jgi:hypothetical protein